METKNKDIPVWATEVTAEEGASGVTLNFESVVYNAEADFRQNTGKQGDVWYYFYEHDNKLFELTPMKDKPRVDGTTKEPI